MGRVSLYWGSGRTSQGSDKCGSYKGGVDITRTKVLFPEVSGKASQRRDLKTFQKWAAAFSQVCLG